mmetsp:Transcript_24913/g.57483  ORF Transcript_24913/g.57483 Transcript_24913/m.57483 type:complete len:1009 (-) Transcript_24913:439-3465(-)
MTLIDKVRLCHRHRRVNKQYSIAATEDNKAANEVKYVGNRNFFSVGEEAVESRNCTGGNSNDEGTSCISVSSTDRGSSRSSHSSQSKNSRMSSSPVTSPPAVDHLAGTNGSVHNSVHGSDSAYYSERSAGYPAGSVGAAVPSHPTAGYTPVQYVGYPYYAEAGVSHPHPPPLHPPPHSHHSPPVGGGAMYYYPPGGEYRGGVPTTAATTSTTMGYLTQSAHAAVPPPNYIYSQHHHHPQQQHHQQQQQARAHAAPCSSAQEKVVPTSGTYVDTASVGNTSQSSTPLSKGPLNVWKVGTCEFKPLIATTNVNVNSGTSTTDNANASVTNSNGNFARPGDHLDEDDQRQRPQVKAKGASPPDPISDGPVIVRPLSLRPPSSQRLSELAEAERKSSEKLSELTENMKMADDTGDTTITSASASALKDKGKNLTPTPPPVSVTPTPSASVNAPGNDPQHNHPTIISSSSSPAMRSSACMTNSKGGLESNSNATDITNNFTPPPSTAIRPPSSTPVPTPHPSPGVDSVLQSACLVLEFDIAEVWLRTGPKTHRLIYTHLRPSALSPNMSELVDIYYGARSSERTHRLSPALCKGAKEARDVVWVTSRPNETPAPPGGPAGTSSGGDNASVTSSDTNRVKLDDAISDVRTAVAVPVCHEAMQINMTVIFFSMRRAVMRPTAVELLVHMSLAAAVASVSQFPEEANHQSSSVRTHFGLMTRTTPSPALSVTPGVTPPPPSTFSPSGLPLGLRWSQLQNVEYLTDGGCAWIHTAVYEGRTVAIKTLKPECQDLAIAINEIEDELAIHSLLHHSHICSLIGAGITSRGMRFLVMERLDGGTISQVLGYNTRIRDRRRRFAKRKQMPYIEVLRHARDLAGAFHYLHEEAVPGAVVIHRDLKADNVGFTIGGDIKLIDFGLAKVVHGADPSTDEVYEMSGETGSLRYMAPEVALSQPYNQKADVYSFGILLWELITYKKPFESLGRDSFYRRVVYGGERPQLHKKWPPNLSKLLSDCWR